MREFLKRLGVSLLVLSTVLWGSGFAFLLPAHAAVTESFIQDSTGGLGKVSPAVPVQAVYFGLGADAAETLNSVTFTITQTAGTVDSSDFSAVKLYRDSNDGANDILDTGTDTLVQNMVAGINVGSASTMTIDTPDSIPAAVQGNWNYVLVFEASGTAADGDTFTVSLASGTSTFGLSAGTVSSTGVTTGNIVVDLTAPTTIADGQNGAGGPLDNQTGVPVEALIDRGFSEWLSPITVTTSSVLLQTNTGNVQGGAPTGANLCQQVFFDFQNNRIVCEHLSDAIPLDASTWYTFTITTSVTDVVGNALASNFTHQFQTGSFVGGSQFNPPPFINATMPPRGGSLPSNGKIVVNFSQVMNSNGGDGQVLDINNVQLFALDSANAPTGSNLFPDNTGWTWDAGKRELRIPLPALTEGNRYQLLVKSDNNNDPGDGSCGGISEPACVMSVDNLAMQGGDYRVDFTAIAADSTPPTILGVFPQDAATGIDRATNDISISMNEFIDPSTITTSTVTLMADLNANDIADDAVLSGTTVSLDKDGRVIHLAPSGLLTASTKYFVILVSGGSGVKDIVGNALSSDLVKTFTTGTNINGGGTDSTSPVVEFANADNFSIFVTFNEPMKFDATTNASQASSVGANDVNNASLWTIETSGDQGVSWSQPVSLVDQGGTLLPGKMIEYIPDQKTVKLQGLALKPGDTFRVTASTSIQDLSSNAVDSNNNKVQGTIKDAQQTGGDLGPGGGSQGGPNFFEMGTNPIRVFPQAGMAGKTTRYKVEFRADTAIPGTGKIKLTFPAGFSFDTTNVDATKRCTTLPTDTFENSDINGPAPNVVTVASVGCDSISRVVTLTLAATGVSADEIVRFEVQGIVNSTVPKDPSTSGYTVDIKTYNGSSLLDSKTSMPFYLSTPGSRTVSGKIFTDDGAGGGTANDRTPNGTEAGVQNINVCLGGPSGHTCVLTDGNGDFSFTQLNEGFYKLDVPPMTSGSVSGGPFFRDVNVSGGNVTGIYFPLQAAAAEDILNVQVTGTGLNGTELDVFAFQGGMADAQSGPPVGGFVVRECTLGTDCNSISLPLAPGKWEIGVGPRMSKEPGTIPTLPEFTFMPPRPVQITVDPGTGVPDLCGGAGDPDICFNLGSALSHQMKGKVVDGSGNAISNVFVAARPSYVDKQAGPAKEAVAQTDVNGNFTLKVQGDETYLVEAFMPGMSGSKSFECTVKNDTGNVGTDNNSTADVNCGGVLIVNDVANFSASALTVGNISDDDLVMIIAKGDTSISGKVLDDSSNAIPFAHVQAMKVDGNGNPSGTWVDAPTDNSGNYTLYVNAGTWKVRANAPGFGELPPLTVTVTQGQNSTGQNLQVQSGGFFTVTGQLTQNATGLEGAHIHAHGPCGGNGTVTDASGNYILKLRATGSCTSAVGDDEGYTIEGFMPGVGPSSTLTSIDVTGNLTNQNLTIGQSGTVVVYVCTLVNDQVAASAVNNCGSNQISTVFVDARDSNGKGYGTRANTTAGQYELSLPAGSYTIFAGEADAGKIGSQSNVTVTAGQTTYVNIAPPSLYTVSGTVSSVTSSCIEGSTVFLNDSTNGRLVLAQVASNGTWSNTKVPAGTYNVGVGKPGCVDSADNGSITVTNANVDENDDTDLARTLVKSNMVVSGQVFLNAANVDFETMVFATSTGGKTVVAQVDTSKTGSDNNYTLNLTSGTTWTITARSDGYESSAITASAASTTADLTLSAIQGYTRQEPKPSNITPSRGGLVKNNNIGDKFEVNVPAGALGTSSNDGSIVTQQTTAVADTATQKVVGKKGIEITPKDASGQPIQTLSSSSGSLPTVTIPYEEADVTAVGGDESEIIIGSWSEDKQSWEPMPTTCDTTANTCTATVSHFSTFGPIVTSSSSSSSGGSSTGTDISAPTDMALTTNGSQVTITWADPTSSSLKKIEVLRNNGTGTVVSNTPIAILDKGVQTYTDTNVVSGQDYIYRLRAKDAQNNQRLTAEQTITVSAPAPVSSPGGGGGGGGSSNSTTNDNSQNQSTTNTNNQSKGVATLPVDPTIAQLISDNKDRVLPSDVAAGSLVKSESNSSVYYIGHDRRRHAFINELVYKTYFKDFNGVKVLTDSELAQIPLGKNVKIRAGAWLIKITSDPKVYAVEPGGKLRWITSEAIAEGLYGKEWNKKIIDIDVSYFVDYEIGEAIEQKIHPNGTLVQFFEDGTVYYVRNGNLWKVTDMPVDHPHVFMAEESQGYTVSGDAPFNAIQENSMGF